MAFESLSEKLQNVFKNLRGKGRLTEADVKTALKEVKMALLEADVSFKVVKQFVKSVQEQRHRTGCNERSESWTDGDQDCKRRACFSDGFRDNGDCTACPAIRVTVIMMAGLQGAGKTTTAAKTRRKAEDAKGRQATCWWPVIFIVRRQSSSCRSTVRSRVLRCSRWETNHKSG